MSLSLFNVFVLNYHLNNSKSSAIPASNVDLLRLCIYVLLCF